MFTAAHAAANLVAILAIVGIGAVAACIVIDIVAGLRG